jgi:hypothetical protein
MPLATSTRAMMATAIATGLASGDILQRTYTHCAAT